MIFDFISGEASTQEGGEKFAKWLAEDTDLTQKEKKSVIEKIKDFFTKLLDAVRSVIEGQGTLNATARAGQKAAQQVPVLDDFFNALDNAIDNRQRMLDGDTAQKNSTGEKTGADVRFSIDPEFEKKYDQWDGSDPRVTFFLGTTGRALKKAGMVNQKIYFDASKILKITNKHPEITDRVIKQIPSVLQNPIVIMKSKDPKNKPRNFKGYTIFGELYVGNNPVLVVLGADMYGRNGMKLDGVKVVSAYRRNNAQSFMDSSDVVFVTKNKERISMWEGRTGLRLPVGDSSTNSPDTTISQTGSSVNTHSMQNGQKNAQNGGSNTQHSLETDSPDIRYSKRVGFDHALTPAEKKKYSRAMQTGEDAGLRVSDNSILVECENESKYQYKYVVYDDMEDGPVIRDVYAIGRLDPNVEDDVASKCHNIARYIRDVEKLKYDNTKQHESVLGTCVQDTSYLLARYNNRSKRFHVIGRGSVENGTNTLNKSVRERTAGQDTRAAGELTESRKSKSIDDTGRTSLLRDDKRLDEMNITLRQVFDSQELETGHHTSQTQVQRVARQLKKSTGSKMDTPRLMVQLKGLFDYIGNNDDVTFSSVMDQAKEIAHELLDSTPEHTVRDEYAQEVLDTLRGMAITLSDEQKAETAYHHDRYGNDLLFCILHQNVLR